MNTYSQIKTKYEKTNNDLTTEYNVFFAFSKKQLEEGKAKINITDNKELISIGAGGFMPKANLDAYFKASELAYKTYTKELKEAKETKEQAIIYELNNHECFYRGNIEPVFDFFSGIYTKEEITSVDKKQLVKEKKFINKEND